MKKNKFVPVNLDDSIVEEPIQKISAAFPTLQEFVSKYLVRDLPDNWHHKLYYDILSSMVIQDKESGKLIPNFRRDTYSKGNRIVPRTNGFKNKNILLLSPRYHAKSSCCSINYPLYEIYKNPNIRILIVSGNEDIATSFVRAIMNQIENNELLIEDFGNLVPKMYGNKKWGEKAFVVKRNTAEHSPTVSAVGVGGRLVSRRADIIIVDDLIDMDTARTKQMRAKTKEWFENVLLPILDPTNGKLIVVGTSWYRDDIYDFLWKESNFDIRVKLKALMFNSANWVSKKATNGVLVNNVCKHKYKPKDYPLALDIQTLFSRPLISRYQIGKIDQYGVMWQDKWSFENLMERKKNMSESSFNRQFLNEPVSESEKVFREKLLQECTRNYNKTYSEWDNTNPDAYGHLVIAIGVDLAISKKETADTSAISIWGMDANRRRILLHIEYGRWSPDETKVRIADCYHRFHPVKIMLENVAFQEMMRQQLEAEDIPVEGFRTTAGAKFNEETGISSIAMLMEQGKVVIPGSVKDKTDDEAVRQLLHDMMVYSYDQHAGDLLMASWFAFEALKDFDNKIKNDRGFFDQIGLVEQVKNTVAAHKILILSDKPRLFRFMYSSFIHIFRSIQTVDGRQVDFIQPDERFMMLVTREQKTVGYIINKETKEIVGKIDGDISPVMCCNLLERVGKFFNGAQIVIDRNGEGEALYMEMVKRMYPELMCFQPNKDGEEFYGEGIKIDSSNLPIAIDYFRQTVNNQEIMVKDEALIKEMGELLSVDGDKLSCSFGTGQRIKTISIALWLLTFYELYSPQKKSIVHHKKFTPHYRVFNYQSKL